MYKRKETPRLRSDLGRFVKKFEEEENPKQYNSTAYKDLAALDEFYDTNQYVHPLDIIEDNPILMADDGTLVTLRKLVPSGFFYKATLPDRLKKLTKEYASIILQEPIESDV